MHFAPDCVALRARTPPFIRLRQIPLDKNRLIVLLVQCIPTPPASRGYDGIARFYSQANHLRHVGGAVVYPLFTMRYVMKRSLIRAALAVVLCVLAISSTASARSRNWIDMRRGHPAGDWAMMATRVVSLLANGPVRTPSGFIHPSLVTVANSLNMTITSGSGHDNKAGRITRTR